MNYYNEIDPYCCEWIQNLIDMGLIPDGKIDSRSIAEVQPDELSGYRQWHFFCGLAGWPLALRNAGWPDDRPIISGSCPCQPFSVAGKGEGHADARDLWPEMYRLVKESGIDCVVGEQVPDAIKHGWLDRVSVDMEGSNYAVGSIVLPAACVGAPQARHRIFWMANAGLPKCDGGTESRREHGGTLHATDRCVAERMGEPIRFGLQGDADQTAGQRASIDERRLGLSGEPDHSMADAHSQLGEQGSSVNIGCDSESDEVLRGGPGGDCLSGSMAGTRCIEPWLYVVPARTEACPGQRQQEENGQSRRHGGSDFWSGYGVASCLDGKFRRVGVESGDEPLAPRIPRGMGRGEPEVGRVARDARKNRVGRLRAYGNAIAVPLATEFVKVVMEIMDTHD